MSQWEDPFAHIGVQKKPTQAAPAQQFEDPFAHIGAGVQPAAPQPAPAANFSEDYGYGDTSATAGVQGRTPWAEPPQQRKIDTNSPDHINGRLKYFRTQYGGKEDDPLYAPYTNEQDEMVRMDRLTRTKGRGEANKRLAMIRNAREWEYFDDETAGQILRRFRQGMTYEMYDELASGMQALLTSKSWDQLRKEYREQEARDIERTGTHGQVANIAGGLVGPGGFESWVAKKALAAGGKGIAKVAGINAAGGAVYGAGADSTDTVRGKVGGALVGGTIGGVVTAVPPLAGAAVGSARRAVGKVADTVTRVGENARLKAAQWQNKPLQISKQAKDFSHLPPLPEKPRVFTDVSGTPPTGRTISPYPDSNGVQRYGVPRRDYSVDPATGDVLPPQVPRPDTLAPNSIGRKAIAQIVDELERNGINSAEEFDAAMARGQIKGFESFDAEALPGQIPEIRRFLKDRLKEAGNVRVKPLESDEQMGVLNPNISDRAQASLRGSKENTLGTHGYSDKHLLESVKDEIADRGGVGKLENDFSGNAQSQLQIEGRMEARVKQGGNTELPGLRKYMDAKGMGKDLEDWYDGALNAAQTPEITGPTTFPVGPRRYAKEIAPFERADERIANATLAKDASRQRLKRAGKNEAAARQRRADAETAVPAAMDKWRNAVNAGDKEAQAAARGVRDLARKAKSDAIEAHKTAMNKLKEEQAQSIRALEELDAAKKHLASLGKRPILLTDENVPVFVADQLRKIMSDQSFQGSTSAMAYGKHLMENLAPGRTDSASGAIHQNMKELHRLKTVEEDLTKGAKWFDRTGPEQAKDVAAFSALTGERQAPQRAGTAYGTLNEIEKMGGQEDIGKAVRGLFDTPRKADLYDQRMAKQGTNPVKAREIQGALSNILERERLIADVRHAMGLSKEEAVVAGVIADTIRRAWFSPTYAGAYVMSSTTRIPQTARSAAIARYLLDASEEGNVLIAREFARRSMLRRSAPQLAAKLALSRQAITSAIVRDIMGGNDTVKGNLNPFRR